MKLLPILFLTSLLLLSSCSKDDPIDPCEDIVCLNGGECLQGDCLCPSGFFGVNCENMESLDPCEGIVCFNDSPCINGVCDCSNGYEGPTCSELSTPTGVVLERLTITNCHFVDANGASYDVGSGPDIFVVADLSGVQMTTDVRQNISSGDLEFIGFGAFDGVGLLKILVYDEDIFSNTFIVGFQINANQLHIQSQSFTFTDDRGMQLDLKLGYLFD